MRVVQVIPTLDQAGAEKQMTYLAIGLKQRGIDVAVCVLTRSGPYQSVLEEAGVPVHFLGKRGKLDMAALARLRRLLRELHPDVVQTWLFAGNVYGRIAARQAGVPYIVASERCVDLWKKWWHFRFDRWLLRHTDRVVVNSSGVREFYAAHGIPGEKIVMIPNGILPPQLPEVPRSEVLQELGLPQESRLVGVVGRLWPQKSIRDAIWSADLLKRIRDDVHLLVIGDGPERQALIRFRDQVEIADRVHFLGHREDVHRLMQHLDVFWNTSLYEGQSNALMEAMALGVPVVAADIPGNRDLVVHEVTGYLVPRGPHMRAEFARFTKKLLEDEDLRRRLGEAGRQRILSEFSLEQMVAGYVALYEGLLSGPGLDQSATRPGIGTPAILGGEATEFQRPATAEGESAKD